jgi:hypothetical protein
MFVSPNDQIWCVESGQELYAVHVSLVTIGWEDECLQILKLDVEEGNLLCPIILHIDGGAVIGGHSLQQWLPLDFQLLVNNALHLPFRHPSSC